MFVDPGCAQCRESCAATSVRRHKGHDADSITRHLYLRPRPLRTPQLNARSGKRTIDLGTEHATAFLEEAEVLGREIETVK